MPNPVSFKCDDISSLKAKTVVSLGRLVNQKNYPSLIRAFKLVCDKHPDWTLKIYGNGDDRTQLQQLINDCGLCENVKLLEATNDVKQVLKDSSIFALSSITEGFH